MANLGSSSWNESEHPRDEDGKFTFKNGGNSGTTTGGAANILYHDSKVKAENYCLSFLLFSSYA